MKISKLVAAVCVFAFCVSFVSVRAQDNPAQAAAREALMKQMGQPEAPAPQTPPAAPTTPAAPAAPVAPAVKPAVPAAPAAAAPVVIILNTNAVAAHPAPKPPAVTIPGPVPIVAPALPISMTKEQRLQALLMLYKADQITPEQYHTRRAAILAEP
ncbi:MAG: hypothetical protein PHY43_02490 [Verrucomicrobiales bacterium]|nr:hypothetical protein [Verrucomicrobiales bacterium]